MLDVVIPVHNGAVLIGQTLRALLEQTGMSDSDRRIIVVDDGSTDGTADIVRALDGRGIELVSLAQRGGRANACNAGARASRADAVLFLDADCLPLERDLLQRHERVLTDGYDLSFGSVTAGGSDFWGHYARVVATEREARVSRGDFTALTSCNLALRRSVFEQDGGFHAGYRHYGFEDRDLIAGMLARGARPHYDPEAAVLHEAGASVAQLCSKLAEAGRHTSTVFQQRHPDVYRTMKFSRVDARTAGLPVKGLAGPLSALAGPAQGLAAGLVDRAWLPMRLRLGMVRLASALAYLRGTTQARAVQRGAGGRSSRSA